MLTLKTKEPVFFLTGEDADLGWAVAMIRPGILTLPLPLGNLENVETGACRYVLFFTFHELSHVHFPLCIFKSKPANCACSAVLHFLGSISVSSSQSIPFQEKLKRYSRHLPRSMVPAWFLAAYNLIKCHPSPRYYISNANNLVM